MWKAILFDLGSNTFPLHFRSSLIHYCFLHCLSSILESPPIRRVLSFTPTTDLSKYTVHTDKHFGGSSTAQLSIVTEETEEEFFVEGSKEKRKEKRTMSKRKTMTEKINREVVIKLQSEINSFVI